ncbi:MAG: hypothetical protein WKF37_00490 [Bryobacteraceae bacterium]
MRLWALIAVAALTRAQEGHWEGSLQVPNREMKFTAELAKMKSRSGLGSLALSAAARRGWT